MAKMVKIENNVFGFPMPMVVVGVVVDGKVNFMAVAWVSRVNANPPLIAVALGKNHHTNRGIHQNREFSVCVPDAELLKAVDYVGIASGAKVDKSTVFKTFKGALASAPLIEGCPMAMECRLAQVVDMPTNELFIGEIVGAYSDEKVLSLGKLDRDKTHPFLLTMPDNSYWTLGSRIGHAWKDGKDWGGRR